MKKRLGIILGLTAVSVLAIVGAFAGIAAQDNDGDSERSSFAERVASILGLEKETVEDAFTQAKDAMQDERRDDYLAKLVEDGTLTQDEADAIEGWHDSQPEVTFNYAETSKFGNKGRGGKFGGSWMVMSESVLDALVEKEVLNQDDADSLQEWYDDRPDAVTKLTAGKGDHGKWGRGGHGRMGRWGDKRGHDSDDDSDAATSTDVDA